MALAPWSQRRLGHRPHAYSGFEGPWIENEWVAQAEAGAFGGCLAADFGPFVPILLPWTDLWEPTL